MKGRHYIFKMGLLVLTFFLVMACKNSLTNNGDDQSPDLGDSLDPIEEVSLIEGADNATLSVNINKSKDAYFDIDFSNIQSNNVINNGLKEAWCIDVWKAINSNNGEYKNIKLYSTYLVEQWKPVNYLLNVQEELRNNDPQITWLEIQMTIWSLRAYPKFDLDTTPVEDLPGQFRKDGEALFSYDKVYEVLDFVEANYKDFNFDQNGAKFAVVAEMPVDVQTVITVVEK